MAAPLRTLRLANLRPVLLFSTALFGLTAALLTAAVPARAATMLPCDIYAAASTPCVAAHSTVRALYETYNGPLYQVKRASDGTTTNISTLSAGGYANAAAQTSFCAGTSCTITEIFDQSAEHNNLTIEGPGGNGGQDAGANAAALPVMAGGHLVYGVYVSPGVGYRADTTTGIGTGPEVWFGPCTGSGPWVQADLENGLFSGGNGNNPDNLGNSSTFVTALVKNNGTTTYAIKGGNAESGGLTTWYNGALPDLGGYAPMHQEGAIVLGTGGDGR